MPENASLDTLKRQRCATASCSATPPYSPSGCPTQLTNKSKLQMSVRHLRVGGRETCTCFCVCVCVCTAHFFETAAVSNFALYLCNFLLRKTVAACRQLNLPNLPPATPHPPGFTAANWQQLVAVATLFAQLPMKMFDNWRHLLYA